VSDSPPGESPRTSIPVTARGDAEPPGPPTVGSRPGERTAGSAPTGSAPAGGAPTDTAGEAGADHTVTVFSALGGQSFFDRLVERFYARVESDEVLLSLYPEPDDLEPARERLALFLAQYWGGPPTYSERRGHPRLRMRHAPYAIGDREKDHWLEAMRQAVEETMPEAPLDDDLRSEVQARMNDYFDMAATHLVNRPAG
jgi:hemoglobin